MSSTMQELGIDQWSPEERLSLAAEIWRSLDQVPPHFFTPAQWAELRECVEADDNDPEGGTPWEEVKAELLAEIDSHAIHRDSESEASNP